MSGGLFQSRAVLEKKNECLCLLTLSAPNFRIHLKPAFFFLFNKLSMGKKFKVERLNVKRPRS